jgi:hypothetical protein
MRRMLRRVLGLLGRVLHKGEVHSQYIPYIHMDVEFPFFLFFYLSLSQIAMPITIDKPVPVYIY